MSLRSVLEKIPSNQLRKWLARNDPPPFEREKAVSPHPKMLVKRGGVYHILSCPACDEQEIARDRKYRLFYCLKCKTHFSVDPGEGYTSCIDHREGSVIGYELMVRDPAGDDKWRFGIADAVPWFWFRTPAFVDREPGSSVSTNGQLYHIVTDRKSVRR